MIEAVNSVIANSSLLRGNTEQVAASRSFAADPDRIQQAAPQAPYISPYISLDLGANKAVLQIRDSETGDVINQFPSESRIRAQSAQQLSPPPPADTAAPSEGGGAEGVGIQGTDSGGANVALAQQASTALSNGAQSGIESLSAGVSVLA